MSPLRFRKKVLDFYKKNGRDFPWRRTTDPYKILVSEVMLQQTQTFRVIPKYQAFLKVFPTIEALAKAPLSRILALWQGLGYNRRALNLQRAAQAAMRSHGGRLPADYEKLLALPGVGPYTAGAVMAFAFNKPVVIIETNIRAAVIHEFLVPLEERRLLSRLTAAQRRRRALMGFPKMRKFHDTEILAILAKAVPQKNARQFYQALMDYGAFLKQKYPNPSRRSAQHSKQSKFEGSDRQIRGHIIRELTRVRAASATQLTQGEPARFERVLGGLVREGLVERRGQRYAIAK